jgi:hypothetical protein
MADASLNSRNDFSIRAILIFFRSVANTQSHPTYRRKDENPRDDYHSNKYHCRLPDLVGIAAGTSNPARGPRRGSVLCGHRFACYFRHRRCAIPKNRRNGLIAAGACWLLNATGGDFLGATVAPLL